MPADVDLVTGRALLEIKVEQGTRTATGRRLYLTGELLWQLLGYVLHDLDDHYRLEAVGVYQARFGHLVLWPLPELLEDLAGRPVDLPEVRARWRRMLTDEQPPGARPPARSKWAATGMSSPGGGAPALALARTTDVLVPARVHEPRWEPKYDGWRAAWAGGRLWVTQRPGPHPLLPGPAGAGIAAPRRRRA